MPAKAVPENTTIKHDTREEPQRPNVRRAKAGRKSRPRRIAGIWARVALLLVFIGTLGIMAVRLVIKVVHPYREAGAQTTQLQGTRAEVALLDRQNTDLRREIAYLKTPGGMVGEARKNGYVRPGEIPFVVEGMMPASSISVMQSPRPAVIVPPRSRTARLWHRLTGH